MIIRKYIAILLMSFANIFILVHAFVPHYHHEGIVTLSSAEITNCKSCAMASCNSNSCDHQGEVHHGLLESCDFGQIIGRDGDPIKDTQSVTPSISEFIVCFCALECTSLLTPAIIEVFRNKAYKPYIDTYNSPYIGSSFGLRAPPTSII